MRLEVNRSELEILITDNFKLVAV